jgi:uncharacterized protein (TIGR03067 family)
MVIGATLLGLAPQDDAVKAELDRLGGTWQVVGHETDGKPASEEHWRRVLFIFKGDHLTFAGDDILRKKAAKIAIVVDPSTNPHVVDMKIVEGEFKGTTLEGVYEIKGDRLRICFRNEEAKNRPNGFSTEKDANLVLFTLERAKQ